MKKIRDFLTIILFCLTLFGLCSAHFLVPDKAVSKAERRKLSQLPEISTQKVLSGDFSEELETYLLDQFPMRELFRSANAAVRTEVLGQSDVNDLWVSDGSIFKHEDALDEKQVEYGVGLINRITGTYLKDMNVYYSVIPDKSYYAADKGFRPGFDYDAMLETLNENLKQCEYIDIFDVLSLDDYYKTDSHWSQDRIFPVAKKIAEAMGMSGYLTREEEYTVKELSPFYGVYFGQAALNVQADTLRYLSSEFTENAEVFGIDPKVLKEDFGIEMQVSNKVYAVEKFEGMDGYDVFLSGAQPFIEIHCPNSKTDRELLIFRDSYGSSIAPLFTGAYSKITLVDLRYMPSMLIDEFVETNSGQDALFLFSASILNKSMLMK